MKLFIIISYTVFSIFTSFAQNGPWQNPLKIAYSTDGTNFTNQQIFQDSSGVPSIARDTNNVLICAFQWFPAPFQGLHWDSIAVKFSYDQGITWTNPTQCIFNGFPANFKRPFDPTIVCTDNGQYRMYFSCGPMGTMSLDTSVNTYSAISSDGIHFSFEPGIRFDDNVRPVIDPALIKYNGYWHYTAPKGAPQDGAFHCSSANGINFTPLSDISSDATHNWTGNLMINDSEMRFYGSGPSIWYSSTTDGNSWSSYTNTNVTGGDPAVFKISANNYIIIYVGTGSSNLIKNSISDFSIFPNPTFDKIQISAPENTDITLISSSGKIIRNYITDTKESILDLKNEPSGIYTIRALKNGQVSIKTIIKK